MDELREFLRDLLRPFGMRHLRRFLRGNWWILLILIAAAGYGIQFSPYAPLLQFVTPKPADEPYFEFVGNEGFDLETSPGTPFPAIDPDQDLIPVVSDSRFPTRDYLTIWSLSQKKVVWRAVTDEIESRYWTDPPLPILYDAPKKEFLVALNLGSVEPLGGRQISKTTLLLIPRESATIRRRIQIPRIERMCDISPSGALLAGVRTHFIDQGAISDFCQPVIVNLEDGSVNCEPVRIRNFFFGSERGALIVRGDSVFRYDLTSHRPVKDSAYICRTSLVSDWVSENPPETTEYLHGSSRKVADAKRVCVWLRSNAAYPSPIEKEGTQYRHRDFLLHVPLDGSWRIEAEPLPARFFDPSFKEKYQYNTYSPQNAISPSAGRLLISRREFEHRMEEFLLVEPGCDEMYLIMSAPPSANMHGQGGLRPRYLSEDLIWIGSEETGQYFHVGDIIKAGRRQ